jgi:ABC-type molybdate transport system substrate-binding protein
VTATLPAPNLITLAVASLAAARSADDVAVSIFYAASAREAIDELDKQVKRLRGTLVAIEAELARTGHSAKTKRLSEGERG